MPNDFDSAPVIIGKKKGPLDKATLNRELAKGNVEIVKKDVSGKSRTIQKIAEETDIVKMEHITLDVAKAIQQSRQELGLSQKDLANKINVKPVVINEYEQGKAIPDNEILGKLERALKVKLRGKDIGVKLENKPAKK